MPLIASRLFGFSRMERIAIDFESSGVWFSARFTECVVRFADAYVDKSCRRQHRLPAFTRKATGNSGGPQIDILYR